jgi:hypothetical protein
MTLTQVVPPPSLDSTDSLLLVNNLNSLYSLAKSFRQPLRSDWMRNYRLVNNRNSSTELSLNGTPNVADSEIYPIVDARIAWMTDQKVMPNVVAAAPIGTAFAKHAEILAQHLEKILGTLFEVNSWDREIVMALWDSAQFGAGILRAEWDSGLDNGLGNVGIRRIDPWSFYPDPDATTLDDAQYLFQVRKMSYAEIERRFPSTSQALIEDAIAFGDPVDEQSRPKYNFSNSNLPMAWPALLPGASGNQGGGSWGLEGQGTQRHVDNILSTGVAVYECWIRENYSFVRDATDNSLDQSADKPDDEPVVTDSWRVVVYTGRTILLDELAENLFQESRHPYVRFADSELGDFWTTPIVSHLSPCQIAINRLLSALQGNAELVGNPIFVDVANSGLARMQPFNRPGTRMTMNSAVANNQGSKPDWLKPPDMPPGVMGLVQFWIARMENISGLSGPQKGQSPSGRQAQQTIQATQEAGFVRIRSALRNLETSLTTLFQLCANLIIQNYDVPRVMAIVGEDGEDSALRLAARHFFMPSINAVTGNMESVPMKFSLIVKAGSSSPTSRQARIAEADALRAMGAIDNEAVLEVHNFPGRQAVVARMQAEAQQMAAIQAEAKSQGGKDQPRGPGTGHPH